MAWRNTGGSAFPRAGYRDGGSDWQPLEGMTLRDYFAGQALMACISGGGLSDVVAGKLAHETIAEHCYRIADAMIEQQTK